MVEEAARWFQKQLRLPVGRQGLDYLRGRGLEDATIDDFRLAVDYWAVEKLLRAEAEAGERALIETLAERLAAAVLRTQPLVAAATIRVRKMPAVMPKTREVVVEIRRTREAGGS